MPLTNFKVPFQCCAEKKTNLILPTWLSAANPSALIDHSIAMRRKTTFNFVHSFELFVYFWVNSRRFNQNCQKFEADILS